MRLGDVKSFSQGNIVNIWSGIQIQICLIPKSVFLTTHYIASQVPTPTPIILIQICTNFSSELLYSLSTSFMAFILAPSFQLSYMMTQE